MAKTSATKLDARARTPAGSRATRRLRREGRIPGVLYGGGENPVPFDVDARDLRIALAGRGAVLDVAIGDETASAVVKATDHHPVRGETMHIDLVRVNLNVAITATVTLELTGIDEAPGVVEGGVIEQVTREVSVEALPTEIPESIVHDVSAMGMNDTVYLSAVVAPAGVKLVEHGNDEVVVATLTPPKLGEATEDEIEQETERVGDEPSAEAAGSDAAASGDDAAAAE